MSSVTHIQAHWHGGISGRARSWCPCPTLPASSSRPRTLQVRAARLRKEKPAKEGQEKVEEDPEAVATQRKLAELEAKFGKGGAKPSFASYVEAEERSLAEAAAKQQAAAAAAPVVSVEVGGTVKQVTDWWLGKKGGLYWLNEISYKLIFVLAGAWVVFRFLGPALGLYDLDDPLLVVPPS